MEKLIAQIDEITTRWDGIEELEEELWQARAIRLRESGILKTFDWEYPINERSLYGRNGSIEQLEKVIGCKIAKDYFDVSGEFIVLPKERASFKTRDNDPNTIMLNMLFTSNPEAIMDFMGLRPTLTGVDSRLGFLQEEIDKVNATVKKYG